MLSCSETEELEAPRHTEDYWRDPGAWLLYDLGWTLMYRQILDWFLTDAHRREMWAFITYATQGKKEGRDKELKF